MLAPGSLLRRNRGLCKPPGVPVLDPDDPIHQGGLVGIWLPGVTPYEISGRQAPISLFGGAYPAASSLGLGLRFPNSSNCYATLPIANEPTTACTWSFWFAIDPAATAGAEMEPLCLSWSPWNKVSVYLNGGIRYTIQTSSAVDLNSTGITLQAVVPYHVVGVYTGTEMLLYFNGVFNASAAQTGTITYAGQTPQLALNQVGNFGYFQYQGIVDNVRIWSRALSAAEVLRLYRDPWAGLSFPADRLPAQLAVLAGAAGLALTARGAALGYGRASGAWPGRIAARGAATAAGQAAALSATTALSARAKAGGFGQGAINFGVIALVARGLGAALGRAGATFTAELQGAAARATGRGGGRFLTSLAARGRTGSAAAATLQAGVQLAVAARAVALGFARAVLALATPVNLANPTLEIVAASQQIPPGAKNVLTLTATDTGPQRG